MKDRPIPVVDLFAGPGGLGEGFSAVNGPEGVPAFQIQLSVEKEPSAHRTLRFRAFMRAVRENGLDLDLRGLDPASWGAEETLIPQHGEQTEHLWEMAEREALRAELGGSRADRAAVDEALARIGPDPVLIGGPPCQAYSLVGRARNRGISAYIPEQDQRHFLYREYVQILERLKPAVFVMENVKGILSARVHEAGVFGRIVSDLRGEGYRLFPLAPNRSRIQISMDPDPYDFVIRAEQFGVPQARHRVIVLGIRSDVADKLELRGHQSLADRVSHLFRVAPTTVTAGDVLHGLPTLRGRLSRRSEAGEPWESEVLAQAQLIVAIRDLDTYVGGPEEAERLRSRVLSAAASAAGRSRFRASDGRSKVSARVPAALRRWLKGAALPRTFNHEARGHMPSDLGRYLYASAFAEVNGASPKAADFPEELAPDHANWRSGKFADRFRVQVSTAPGSTVTSHISKDGHYFIHPDPSQCRSLSVREAARIQTFPDDYIFLGNRTQQYVQVGNAVPPFLAYQIAIVVQTLLSEVH